MTRYIDADKLPRHGNRGGVVYWRDIEKYPTADVRENVRGEWIKLDDEPVYIIECSECGDKLLNMIGQPLPKFCSNCGAEMKGERYDMR